MLSEQRNCKPIMTTAINKDKIKDIKAPYIINIFQNVSK